MTCKQKQKQKKRLVLPALVLQTISSYYGGVDDAGDDDVGDDDGGDDEDGGLFSRLRGLWRKV